MTERRRRDGERAPVGAWDTPAVVVRAPDGSIVDHRAGRTTADEPPTRSRSEGASENESGASPARARVRPRRIPGAPGAVLVVPTLRPDAADGREERRRRRAEAPVAPVTPLPPRPVPQDDRDGEGHGLRLRSVSRRGARRPEPARAGEPRRQRVIRAVAALNLDRLLPADQEARDRRIARIRRIGARVGSVTLALMLIYAVFPVRTYLNQRSATDRARQQVEVLSRENDRLEQRAEDLRDPETVEELARRELGLVLPGEESYGVFAPPAEQAPPNTTTTAPAGDG
ncbi:MAG TPA: septum formation initiator family protein [Acidimicrobiales bacterium]|nr:septum formation initiator family protein [Acidimicrobiales bacterium]